MNESPVTAWAVHLTCSARHAPRRLTTFARMGRAVLQLFADL